MSDLDEVATLLHVHEKLRGHPKLKAILDWVEARLEGHAKDLEPEKAEEPTDEHGDEPEVTHDSDDEPVHVESVSMERKI